MEKVVKISSVEFQKMPHRGITVHEGKHRGKHGNLLHEKVCELCKTLSAMLPAKISK